VPKSQLRTAADTYIWAERFKVEVPGALVDLRDRMRTRPAVRRAMVTEGLL
jgi:glutathione S-transferase